jgi:hypothetical protein
VGGRHGSGTTSEPVVFPRPAQAILALGAGVVAVMLAAGCGGSGDAGSGPGTLTIAFSPSGEGGDARELELRCDPPAGTVPDPAGACAELGAMEDPFAPVPGSTACTEIYGGPQVITVRGTWSGRPVDARFSRVDGCQIERYDRLVGALGIAALTR